MCNFSAVKIRMCTDIMFSDNQRKCLILYNKTHETLQIQEYPITKHLNMHVKKIYITRYSLILSAFLLN